MQIEDVFLILLLWTVAGFFMMLILAAISDTNPTSFTGKFYRNLLLSLFLFLAGPVWWFVVLFVGLCHHISCYLTK